jgi:predicted SprT family Zn-dependent metalloprotease
MFVSRTGPRSGNDDAMQRASRRVIRLSLPLLTGQAESEIIGTLAHEMIHQWQFDRLKRRPNHGRDFLRIMAAMNRDGLGITVRHSLDAAVRRHTRYRWQCLACGRDYYRQRHTIRPEEHRCSGCHGRLKEVSLESMPGPTVRDPVPAAAPVSIIQLSLFP